MVAPDAPAEPHTDLVTQEAGHRLLTHSEDVGYEVWAPSRDECFAEAVRALVGAFAQPPHQRHAREVRVELGPAAEEDLLADLLDEVLDTVSGRGLLPIDLGVTDTDDGGLRVEMIVVPLEEARMTGRVPAAISERGLAVSHDADQVTCRFVLQP